MLFSFILSLFAATAVFGLKHPNKACTRELEGIVYVPQNCAYNYLHKITQTLEVQAPLLWTNQAQGVIETFKNTYGVEVFVINAMGVIGTIDASGVFVPTLINAITAKAFSHNIARSNALGEGFTSNLTTDLIAAPSDVYSTVIWNPNGQMYTIAVALESSKAPSFC
jgi:hypothetical protein